MLIIFRASAAHKMVPDTRSVIICRYISNTLSLEQTEKSSNDRKEDLILTENNEDFFNFENCEDFIVTAYPLRLRASATSSKEHPRIV